jgi:cell division protein FtsQ
MAARRRGRKEAKRKRGSWGWLAILPAAALGWALWSWAPQWETRFPPIAYVRVQGDILNIDPNKLKQALLPAVHANFFALDIGEIEGVARAFPWVDAVQVKRLWPDGLEVKIAEHRPAARWGDKALLNQRGERFQPEEVEAFSSLPAVYGQSGMEAYLLGILKNLNGKIRDKGINIVSLDLSKRRAWVIKLSNGLEMHLGRQDPLAAMDRFLALADKMGEGKIERFQRVDLRYPNGFAAVFKPEAEDEGATPPEPGAGNYLMGRTDNLALEKQ